MEELNLGPPNINPFSCRDRGGFELEISVSQIQRSEPLGHVASINTYRNVIFKVPELSVTIRLLKGLSLVAKRS